MPLRTSKKNPPLSAHGVASTHGLAFVPAAYLPTPCPSIPEPRWHNKGQWFLLLALMLAPSSVLRGVSVEGIGQYLKPRTASRNLYYWFSRAICTIALHVVSRTMVLSARRTFLSWNSVVMALSLRRTLFLRGFHVDIMKVHNM